MKRLLPALLIASGLAACETLPANSGGGIVAALRETALNQAPGESAQGVALWAATDKSKSRIIGAQPQGEIDLYDLSGAIVQRVGLKAPGSVDVRDGFYWLDGEGAILAATDAFDNSIAFYKLDYKTGLIGAAPRGRIKTGGGQIASVCLGQVSADQVAAATFKNGVVKVWSLAIDPWGAATGVKISEFGLGALASACAIDDKTGALYVAEAQRGLWRVNLSDAAGAKPKLIDSLKPQGKLETPINALAVWSGPERGYVLASGPTGLSIYDRGSRNAFVAEIQIGPSKNRKVDGATGGLGLAASGQDMGPDFPRGALAIQDDANTKPNGAANFKIVSFADIEARLSGN